MNLEPASIDPTYEEHMHPSLARQTMKFLSTRARPIALVLALSGTLEGCARDHLRFAKGNLMNFDRRLKEDGWMDTKELLSATETLQYGPQSAEMLHYAPQPAGKAICRSLQRRFDPLLVECSELATRKSRSWSMYSSVSYETGEAASCLEAFDRVELLCPSNFEGYRAAGRLDAFQPNVSRMYDRSMVLTLLTQKKSTRKVRDDGGGGLFIDETLDVRQRMNALVFQAKQDQDLPLTQADQANVRLVFDGAWDEVTTDNPCRNTIVAAVIVNAQSSYPFYENTRGTHAKVQAACVARLEALIQARNGPDFNAEVRAMPSTMLGPGQLEDLERRMHAVANLAEALPKLAMALSEKQPATSAVLWRAAQARGNSMAPLQGEAKGWLETQARFGVGAIEACGMTFAKAARGARVLEGRGEMSVCYELTLEHIGGGEYTYYTDDAGRECTDYAYCSKRVTVTSPETTYETTSRYIGGTMRFPVGPGSELSLAVEVYEFHSGSNWTQAQTENFTQSYLTREVEKRLPDAWYAWENETTRQLETAADEARFNEADEAAAKLLLGSSTSLGGAGWRAAESWMKVRYELDSRDFAAL